MCGRTRAPDLQSLDFPRGWHHVWGSSDSAIRRWRWIRRLICDQLPYSKLAQGPYFWEKPINGSVQWLGVPHFLRTNVPPWTNNILAPSPSWGTGGTAINPNWWSQPGRPYGSVAVPCSDTVRVMPAYVCRSPENTRSAVRRVYDKLLQDNCTSRMQSLSTSHSLLRNRLVNQWNDNWNYIWDEPVDQMFLWRIYVGSFSISKFYFLSVTVWVATFGSMFGSLYASYSSEW